MDITYTAKRAARLSAILLEDMHFSMGLMNRYKWTDDILVNGIPRHTDHMVLPGDTVTVHMDEAPPEYPAQQGPLTVLYEDDWLLAADKPAGMLIHPSRSQNTDTLANFVLGHYEKMGKTAAFHPITRLDRDTFGVVLIAKHAHAHQLMQASRFQKTYHAWVYGGPQEDGGIISAPIARRPLPSLLREVRPDGKESTTLYRVIRREGNRSLLELTPVTGRTHQLRVHCAYMGFPILGDPQYANDESKALSDALGLRYQQLRASSIDFSHPMTGEKLEISSRLRMDLQEQFPIPPLCTS